MFIRGLISTVILAAFCVWSASAQTTETRFYIEKGHEVIYRASNSTEAVQIVVWKNGQIGPGHQVPVEPDQPATYLSISHTVTIGDYYEWVSVAGPVPDSVISASNGYLSVESSDVLSLPGMSVHSYRCFGGPCDYQYRPSTPVNIKFHPIQSQSTERNGIERRTDTLRDGTVITTTTQGSRSATGARVSGFVGVTTLPISDVDSIESTFSSSFTGMVSIEIQRTPH